MFVPTKALLIAVLAFTNGGFANGNALKKADALEPRGDMMLRDEVMTVTVTDCEGGNVPTGTGHPSSIPTEEASESIPSVPAPSVPAETSTPAPVPSVKSTGSAPVVSAPSTSLEEVSSAPTSAPSSEASTESDTPSATETPEASSTAPDAETSIAAAPTNSAIDNALIGAVGLAAMLAF